MKNNIYYDIIIFKITQTFYKIKIQILLYKYNVV